MELEGFRLEGISYSLQFSEALLYRQVRLVPYRRSSGQINYKEGKKSSSHQQSRATLRSIEGILTSDELIRPEMCL